MTSLNSNEKLFYYSDGTKVLVEFAGDEFLATPQEAVEKGFRLLFGWGSREASEFLLGRGFRQLGVRVAEGTVSEFETRGGIFEEAVTYLRAIRASGQH
jgi:hypothetical protein